MSSELTVKVIANALGVSDRTVQRRAAKESWLFSETKVVGGVQRLYGLSNLPSDVQSTVVLHLHKTGQLQAPVEPEPTQPEPAALPALQSRDWTQADSEALWQWASTRSQKLRDRGLELAQLMIQVDLLLNTSSDSKMTETKALKAVAAREGQSWKSMHRWWSKGGNGVPLKNFPQSDWAALLIPGYAGCTVQAEIPVLAWDWFLTEYLTRDQPSLSDTYRRTEDTAKANGWGKLPSEDTFRRRLEEIPIAQRIYLRKGPEALGQMFPPQRRDKSMLSAGEIVNGDGLKFDRLWVRFEDGEIINTATGWFWQDVYSGKILAWRLAKTENTDLFRLATYDLTAICVPRIAIIDNTRVAANKAMTGQAKNRHRFTNRPDDPMGLLPMVGIEPQFTNPDKVLGSPGAKSVERAFGKGGLHEMVATNPKFKDRGYSKKTAIDFAELQQVVAEEVARFNARPGRRTAVCRGVLSFDQAFEESFAKAEVRRLSAAQRSLLLLMPEVVTCNKRNGEIQLKAGSGPWGKHRYWDESLAGFMGKKVVVYYDPENLLNDVSVYRMDGQFISSAQHMADMAVITTTTDAREFHTQKARFVKANKKAGAALKRMDTLTSASYYPSPEEVSVPEPGIVRPNFGLRRNAEADLMPSLKVANGPDEELYSDEAHMLRFMDYLPRRIEEDF